MPPPRAARGGSHAEGTGRRRPALVARSPAPYTHPGSAPGLAPPAPTWCSAPTGGTWGFRASLENTIGGTWGKLCADPEKVPCAASRAQGSSSPDSSWSGAGAAGGVAGLLRGGLGDSLGGTGWLSTVLIWGRVSLSLSRP